MSIYFTYCDIFLTDSFFKKNLLIHNSRYLLRDVIKRGAKWLRCLYSFAICVWQTETETSSSGHTHTLFLLHISKHTHAHIRAPAAAGGAERRCELHLAAAEAAVTWPAHWANLYLNIDLFTSLFFFSFFFCIFSLSVFAECDKLRKDGFRSSQYYSQGPTFSDGIHSSSSLQDEDEDEDEKKVSERHTCSRLSPQQVWGAVVSVANFYSEK